MADDAKKDVPIFASVTPSVRLENDALPENPKRVIRTFAADVARMKGAPMPTLKAPQPIKKPSPPAKPAPPAHPTLADAISALPDSTENIPHLPPLQKGREGMYVRRPEPIATSGFPQKWGDAFSHQVSRPVEYETILTNSKPSFFESLSRMLFGNHQETQARITAIPTISSYSPRDTKAPAPEPISIPVPQSIVTPPDLPPPVSVAPPAAAPEPLYPLSPAAAESELRDRESVLTRLRARVAEHREEAPAPVYPSPKPEAVKTPRIAPPMNLPGAGEGPEKSDRLHTMSSDFGARVEQEKASAFSVLAAQADSGAMKGSEAKAGAHRGLAYALIATVLVVGGSLLVYYTYSTFNANQPVPVVQSAPATLINGDDSITLSGSGVGLLSSLADAANASLPIGTVRIVQYADTTGALADGGALVAATGLPAPDILLRNLGALSTVGILHAGTETRAFFVLSANSYERTFAGMLAWEPMMTSDLATLYPAYPDTVPVAMLSTSEATSTATSTASRTSAQAAPPSPKATAGTAGFVDEVVANHDVRAYKDAEGRTVLLYGYRDQNTLIIARDETAFTLLLARISAN